jgi:FkbM family methyltransferase
MVQRFKRIVYLAWQGLRLVLWQMTGGRRIRVAGATLKLEPATMVPKHRGFRFPRTIWSEEIVKYSDSVQMRALLKVLCTGHKTMVMVEVGAFDGGYAAILASIMAQRGGRFIAIEPNPDSFALLQKNIAKNHLEHIVSCWNVAIGEKEGNCSMVGDGSQSYAVQRNGPIPTSKAEKDQVPMVTLQSVLTKEGITCVDVLLVDCEGAELPVLRSFPWEDVSVNRIYCEMHP